MSMTVVITGAAGNLGTKLRARLEEKGSYALRLLDIDPRGDPAVAGIDLARPGPELGRLLAGADAIVHLAANSDPFAAWDALTGPNVDGVLNLYLAAASARVSKVLLASSVWAVAERIADEGPILAGDAMPDAHPYAVSKMIAERIGAAFAAGAGADVATLALRIGVCRPGANPWRPRGGWEDECWLANDDFCDAIELALRSPLAGFAVINLVSNLPGSRWSLAEAVAHIGYRPQLRTPPQPRAGAIARMLKRLKRARLGNG